MTFQESRFTGMKRLNENPVYASKQYTTATVNVVKGF